MPARDRRVGDGRVEVHVDEVLDVAVLRRGRLARDHRRGERGHVGEVDPQLREFAVVMVERRHRDTAGDRRGGFRRLGGIERIRRMVSGRAARHHRHAGRVGIRDVAQGGDERARVVRARRTGRAFAGEIDDEAELPVEDSISNAQIAELAAVEIVAIFDVTGERRRRIPGLEVHGTVHRTRDLGRLRSWALWISIVSNK